MGPSAPERLNILRNTRTIAIVGMSDKISRASYFVATYLQSASPYKLYFVNPILAAKGKLVLGQPVYPSLQDLPEVPDLVEIFRRNEDLPGVVQEAASTRSSRPDPQPPGPGADLRDRSEPRR